MFTSLRQAKRQPGAFRSRSAQYRDFSRHECSPRFKSCCSSESPLLHSQSESAASLFPHPVWYLQKLPRCQPRHSRHSNSTTLSHFTTPVTLITVERAPPKNHV